MNTEQFSYQYKVFKENAKMLADDIIRAIPASETELMFQPSVKSISINEASCTILFKGGTKLSPELTSIDFELDRIKDKTVTMKTAVSYQNRTLMVPTAFLIKEHLEPC